LDNLPFWVKRLANAGFQVGLFAGLWKPLSKLQAFVRAIFGIASDRRVWNGFEQVANRQALYLMAYAFTWM